ncbi:hypothetical protein [Streptomyces sp. CC219B]|uniref:hypothetical protein n=1 Tax=Streptomyces sp. CC219B TaxID=3044574 RepID=UPI0024A8A8C2|nr:hypothetical protein [Streptomyces sp. CC219B]
MRARTRLLPALCSTLALTAACAGPGGVELGHDWRGATTFALARVDGLVTVVGVNARAGRAESLVVVPQQADDTDAVSPGIVELADGRWLLGVPRDGGGPDRRYVINRTDHVLDGMAGDERLRRVLPGKNLVAEVPGLPDRAGTSGVLVKDPSDWSTRRELRIPGTIGLAASDPGTDTVCLADGDRQVHVVDMHDGETTPVPVPTDLEIMDLACPSGRPVVVGARSSASGPLRTDLTRTDTATTVSVAGGRPDAVAATGSSIVLAVSTGQDTEIVELDAVSGKQLHRARVEGVAAALALTPTPAGWLLYTERTVTRVDLATGRTKRFDLPGILLDA